MSHIKSHCRLFPAAQEGPITYSCEKCTRRKFVAAGGSFALATLGVASFPFYLSGAALPYLEVAYAGSMGSMTEGPLKSAVRDDLHVDMHGRAQGSNALALLIVGGSIRPDVFIPVTPDPMLTVLQAGKAKSAEPIAHTEMVIAYSPKSRFAPQFDAAAKGKTEWWKVLQQPGLRFGRTDPVADPQGRNIIFTMMLAAEMYHQPDLVKKTLGSTINDRQIFSEPTVLARLQSGNWTRLRHIKSSRGRSTFRIFLCQRGST